MLSIHIIRKTLRDYAIFCLAIWVLLAAFVTLFMFATNSIDMKAGMEFAKLPFIRRLMEVMIGTDPLINISQTTITAFVFTHPMMWLLLITMTITIASGVLAGEMDRGTMDLLAVLPISRAAIYNSLWLVLAIIGLPMCWTVWLFMYVGREMVGATEIRAELFIPVAWNLYAVFIVIASFALFVSAACSRRGLAVGIAFFFVFYAFVLNLLRAMWPALDRLAWTDFLHYYHAMMIVRDEGPRPLDLTVLACAAAVFWLAGLWAWRRRDIPAR